MSEKLFNHHENLLRIFHIGDMQIELRTTGIGAQRYFEFEQVLNVNVIKAIEKERPDLVLIPGDLFQFELTTGEEQKMLSRFLHNILGFEFVKRIVIIPGNHDIKQNHNGLIIDGEKMNTTDSIDSIVSSINNPRISYYRETGIFKDSVYDLNWAVWSQIAKHSAKEIKPAYSPWEENEVPSGNLIELYHDPISSCVSFDGEIPKHFANYKVSLKDFKANCILAADIHAPQITWFDGHKLFTYCSSTVMRNFGEGDYFNNDKPTVYGNRRHGYNIVEFDLTKNIASSCTFVEVENPVHRFTINIDKNFNYSEESIKQIALKLDQSSINMIRLVCEGNISDFVKNQELFLSIFKEIVKNPKIEFAHSENVIGVDIDDSMFEDLESVINKDKILQIAEKYVNEVVDSTTMIDLEDKDEAKKLIVEYLTEQLNEADLSQETNKLDFVRLRFKNFMNFDDAEIVFDPLQNINVIRGTNGVGKTTAMHGFNWILADQISKNQNLRNSVYNNLLYFNNNSEDDQVIGESLFYRNGEEHLLEKTITRTWKKNKKDIKAKNISELVSKVEVTYKLTKGGEVLDHDESKKYIESLFSFDQLSSMTFINGGSIDDMMNTSVEDMSQSFLEVMGLDISGKLEEMYETLKTNKMKDLAKPSKNIQEIELTIDETISKIDLTEKEINLIETKILNSKNNINTNVNSTKVKRDSLHNVMNESEYFEKLSSLNNSKVSTQNEINDHKQKLNEFNTISDEEYQNNLNQKRSELTNTYNQKAESQNKLLELTNQLLEKKEQGVKIRESIVDEVNKKIKSNQELIDNHNKDIDKLFEEHKEFDSKYDELTSNRVLEIENKNKTHIEEKEKLQSELKVIDENQFSITNHNNDAKNKINNNKQEIEKLEHSKTCTLCEQDLPASSLEVIKHKIVELENQNKECLIFIEENDKLLIDNQTKIDELKTKIFNELNVIEENQLIISNIYNKTNISSDQEDIRNKQSLINNDIQEKRKLITEIKLESDNLENSKKELVKSDENIQKLVQEIGVINNSITELNTNISNFDQLLSNINNEIVNIETKIKEVKLHNEKKQELSDKLLKLSFDLENFDKLINEHLTLESKINENKIIKEEIKKLESDKVQLEKEVMDLFNEKSKYNSNKQMFEEDIKRYKEDIENIKHYTLVENSLKLYKRIIGKKGLPQYVFAHLIPLLNKKLNESLNDVDFRLIFDQDSGELRFYSLTKDVTQPLQFISGMERTVTGLAIAYIKRLLNHSNRFNFIFIDEISGTLNDGEDLSYEAKDYQKIVMNFIDKLSKNVQIYIIDHSLKFYKSRILEVIPGSKGSTIIEVQK